MHDPDYRTWTDEALEREAQKLCSFHWTQAFMIGFLVGIVVFSIFHNTFGWLMLIPLWIAHKFTQDPRIKQKKQVEDELQARKLTESSKTTP